MPYNATTGQWEYEDDSVAKRLPGLLAQNNPLMKQARTQGLQFGNKRGLLNSSIAGQAGEAAALGVALPVASQDAAQTAQKNLTQQQLGSSERIATMNVAAHDREKAAAAITEMRKKYAATFAEIVKNNDIPAAARNNYLSHISAIGDTDLNLIEQMYGIDLDWDSPVAAV